MKLYSKTVCLMGALALFGCTKNNYYGDEDRIRISLSSMVELNDRALGDLQIVQGQTIGFFVTTAGEVDEVLYENEELIANGTGGFTYSNPMYYPYNGDNVDFYAVHPHDEDATLGEPFSFSITANQTTQNGFFNSDLLYANKKNQGATVQPVSMAFNHRLSKLDFVIRAGNGVNLAQLNEVAVLNLRPTTTIDLQNGNLTAATGTPVEVTAMGVRGTTGSETSVSDISAIVVPQTFSPDGTTQLVRITVGNVQYFYVPGATDADIVFESGKRYTLNMTVNQGSITVVTTINDWTDGGSIDGDGNIE